MSYESEFNRRVEHGFVLFCFTGVLALQLLSTWTDRKAWEVRHKTDKLIVDAVGQCVSHLGRLTDHIVAKK